MVGCCTISVVCVLIHRAYDLVVQHMNFGFACVGCPSLITLPTNCSIAQYFLLYINVIFEGQFSSTFGGFCPRGFVQGDFVQRGFVPGGFCPGGFCQGHFVQGDFVLIPYGVTQTQSIEAARHRPFSREESQKICRPQVMPRHSM